MYTIYAIASVHRKYVYVGISSNLKDRIARHNAGHEQTTKPYRPFVLIYTTQADNRVVARKMEKHLKSRNGKRFLYQIIRDQFPDLKSYGPV